MRTIASILAGVALLAGIPAIAKISKADRAAADEAKLAKALAGRTAGTPISCISLRNIRSSRVIDRTAIVYEVGNTLYVNRPTGGASTLDDDDILVTKTSMSQLCSIDIVHLIDRSTHFPSGFVNLGKFVPYNKPPKAS